MPDAHRRNAWLAGAAEGTAATLAMSGFMYAAQRAGQLGEMPPRRIASAMAGRLLGRGRSSRRKDALGAAAHLAFGAGVGALFHAGVLRASGMGAARPLAGAAYAAVVWLVSYAGWIPALGILPPPHRDRPGRPRAMLAAHLVYGVVLGLLASRDAAAVSPAGRSRPANA
jgi:hypothetical protein